MKREIAFAAVGAKCRGVTRGALRPAGWLSIRGLLLSFLFGVVALHAQTSGTWQAQDIGPVAAGGSSSASGDAFTVSGSGADIWGTSDEFHFYAQTLSGDGSITARITSMNHTDPWAKAGVMIRDSLAANAPHVSLVATPDWHGIVALQRASAGGETVRTQGPGVNAPYWLRLTRNGSGIIAATSIDGATWTTTGSFSTAMGATVYIGLAVSSHNDGTLCTATFDNVSVAATGSPSGPPTAPASLTATATSSSQIALSWTNTSTTQTGISVERSTGGSFEEVATLAGSATSYTDSGLSPLTTYFYQVRGINSAGYGPASNTASATTTAPPPDGGWQSADVGTSTAGATSASGDTVSLTGSGSGIGSTADGFRYYYNSAGTGDVEIIVRVASLQNTNPWAMAGIMLRASLDPGSPQAGIYVSAEHGTVFQSRTTANGETQTSTPTEDGGAPRWLKLVFRAASTDASEPIPAWVGGYVSSDGQTWTQAGGLYLASTTPWSHIGLVATSHQDGTRATAQFDNLRLLTPPPTPTDFRVTGRGPDGEIHLAWSYDTTDVDEFVIRTNPQRAGNHDWHIEATVPGTARSAVIHIDANDAEQVEIKAHRDLVRSPAARLWAKSTITPELAVTGTTSNSISLRVTEEAGGLSGTEDGPWSIERSSDGVNFVEIVSGLTPTGANNAYSVYADYTDAGLPPGVTRYYRARQLEPNGDRSGYSPIVSASTTAAEGIPAAPTELTATALSSSQIQLTWTDNATDETTFEVQRSSDGVNFGITYSGFPPNTTSMTDPGLAASTTYYYRVRAVNSSGASAYSNIAHATTPATSSPPPSGTWQSGDVGPVVMTGSDSTSGETVTVTGGGADIWDRVDSFRFRYRALNGDGSITARVVSMTNTDNWAKAGVMIRNSLVAGSRNVFAAVTPAWNGITAQVRTTNDNVTTSIRGPAANAPYWLRLTRTGTSFTAAASPDGVTWTTYATFNVTMDQSVAVGLAVTSHNQNALCTATFDNVTITGASTPLPPPEGSWSSQDIGAVGVAGSHTAESGAITIRGSGADIWGTADAFHFVWQTRTGDDVVEAQVGSMGNTHGWAKAGVMIRESTDPNAPNVFVALTPTWHGIVAQARGAAGGQTTSIAGPARNAPYWVRLQRSGEIFTAATSPDGVTWTPFASFKVTMSSTALFGFAVTSHDNTQLNETTFLDPYVGDP